MTANQKYKSSGTSQSFKQWLINEQKKGSLKVHNESEFTNAVGNDNTDKVKNNLKRNVLIVVGLGVVAFGVYSIMKKKSNIEE